MILLLLFLVLIITLTYPILAWKIFKAFKAKNKPNLIRLSTILLILILIPGFYFKLLPGSNLVWYPIEKAQERRYNIELTGFEFNDGELIYEYETQRAFNGDGYSIWIYKIDDQTAEYFKQPKEEFFTKHPRTGLRSHWEPEFWKKTPFDKQEQKFLDFADSSLDDLDFELEDLLYEKGNYYAYEYYMHSFGVGNIDFYILCPKRKLIVKINHNT
jgi:hypothetical protein